MEINFLAFDASEQGLSTVLQFKAPDPAIVSRARLALHEAGFDVKLTQADEDEAFARAERRFRGKA